MAYQIERGVQKRPVRAVVYGPEGVGKTTFAAKWPGAVFIDIEDGSGHYDVARLPHPDSWPVLIDEIRASAGIEEVGTLVVDTADAAERLCTEHVLAQYKVDSIEKILGGYGKGYTILAEEFGKLMSALDACVAAGKNVVVLSHAQIKKFEQPDELGAYDRWELKLSKKCAPLLKEWADLLLFANFKADVMKGDDGKYRTTGGKRRIMYASHTAAYDAKNRLGLTDEMPFDFAEIAAVVPAQGEAPVTTTQATVPEERPQTPAPTDTVAKDGVSITMPQTPPYFTQLYQLMADYQVNAAQLMAAVGSRENNPYTADTPIEEYDEAFVRGVLLTHWEAIVGTIHELENQVPFD